MSYFAPFLLCFLLALLYLFMSVEFLLLLLPLFPLPCPSLLFLFFFRALWGAPCGPVVKAFLHRPHPRAPPLSGWGAGPPPAPVLLPPSPLPKLAHLRPGPSRVPLRSAFGPALPPGPQPHAMANHCSWFSWDCACSVFVFHALPPSVSACLPVSVLMQIASSGDVSFAGPFI